MEKTGKEDDEAEKSSVKYHSFWSDSAVAADFLNSAAKQTQSQHQQQHENPRINNNQVENSHQHQHIQFQQAATTVVEYDENHYDDVGAVITSSTRSGESGGGSGLNRGDSGYHTTHSQGTYSSEMSQNLSQNPTPANGMSVNAINQINYHHNHHTPSSMMPPPMPPPPPSSLPPAPPSLSALSSFPIRPQTSSERSNLLEMQSRSRLPISIRSNLNLTDPYVLVRPLATRNQATPSVFVSEEPSTTAFKPILASNDPFKRNNVRRSLDSSIAANQYGILFSKYTFLFYLINKS